MELKLDRQALHALIDNDPELKLHLQAALVSEVSRRYFEKDAARIIRAADSTLYEKMLTEWATSEAICQKIVKTIEQHFKMQHKDRLATVQLPSSVTDALKVKVHQLQSDAMDEIERVTTDRMQRKIKEALADRWSTEKIEEQINKRIDVLVTKEIQARVDAAVQVKIAALNAVLSS